MTSTALQKEAIKADLAKDSREISAIWNEAINQYNQTVNQHDEPERVSLTTPRFKDAQDMKTFGLEEMQKFRSWRTKDDNMVKLRTLFMNNIDIIDAGSKQLLAAASASFPPALAISTAMTYVLTGFKSQRTDYNTVVNFFEDMNSFLQRVSIIEKRVPAKKAFQNALIDVFTAMLSLCAVARKFVMLGRFKKWVMNTVFGGDEDLRSDRTRMDISLTRLQSYIEFAILDNTENMLEQQERLGDVVAGLRRELGRNREVQEQIAANQNAATEKISTDVQTMMQDIKKLLSLQQEVKSAKNRNAPKPDELSGNVVRHFYTFAAERGILPEKTKDPFPDMLAVLTNLEKSQVEDTGSWLWEHPSWLAWADCSQNSQTLLWLEGDPGVGKTHLSLAIYQQLRDIHIPELEICTAYFSCRRPDIQRRHTKDLLRNCAIQIVDQSPTIRQRLEAMWRSFRIAARVDSSKSKTLDSGTVDNDIFIYENFRESSASHLFIVVDGLDQFHDKGEIERFFDVVRTVQDQKLRIKFIVTAELIGALTSDTMNMVQSQAIHLGRDQIQPDLKKILWKGINSEDSAYEGLRKLTKYSKQQLAQRITHNADNLLYVDQTLRFLANEVREGNIENLLDSIPINLVELYEAILRKSLQNFNPDRIRSLKSIIMWLNFSEQPLTLERLGLLAGSAGLSSEQILSFVLQFFEVDVISKDTASFLSIDFTELFDNSIGISTDNLLSGNSLRLQVKNRATEIFLSSAGPQHALRTTSVSDAHRIIFLSTVEIILRPETDNRSLHEYAIEYSLHHWNKIVPKEHTKEEQVEVCRSFSRLMSEDRYAEGLVRHPRVQESGDIMLPDRKQARKQAWNKWSSQVRQLGMGFEDIEYWQDPGNALNSLVTALVRIWLKTPDVGMSVKAWRWAKDISGEDNIYKLASILSTDLDCHARFAVGSALAQDEGNTYKTNLAVKELKQALSDSEDAAFQNRCNIQIATVYGQYSRWDECVNSVAAEYCTLVLDGEHTSAQASASEETQDLQDMNGESAVKAQGRVVSGMIHSPGTLLLQQSMRAEVLRIQGVALKGMGKNIEAAESFCKARRLSTELTPVQNLFDELFCLKENPALMVKRVLGFSPIDRLRFVTGNSEVGEVGHTLEIPPERLLVPASAKSQKSDEIVNMYHEIIKALDAEHAGAPIRVDLARILWQLRYNIKSQADETSRTERRAVSENHAVTQQQSPGAIKTGSEDKIHDVVVSDMKRVLGREDQSSNVSALQPVKEAKFLLNQVLDSVSGERTYKLTHRDPLSVANSALQLMSDILLEEFRSSKKIEDKVQILLQAKELPRRKFIASQPLIMDDIWSQYHTVVAHMLKKIGPMSEYEQVMTGIFDKAMAGLNDDTSYNDHVYLTALTRIFAMEPSLRKFGEMLTIVNNDGGTYCCNGICLPFAVFDYWESDDTYYKCLICTECRLCQSCYDTRMQWNRDPTTKSATDIDFCCVNGQYMPDPVEGWSKQEDTYVYDDPSKGEDKRIYVEKNELTNHLRQVWKDAWEGVSSGI